MATAHQYRVFLDTNVLINEYAWRSHFKRNRESQAAYEAYHFLKQRGFRLYAATFAVLQFVSSLVKFAKVAHDEVENEVMRLTQHLSLVHLTRDNLLDGLSLKNPDVEDAVQYALCRKVRCQYLITANTADFVNMPGVVVVHPSKIRAIFALN